MKGNQVRVRVNAPKDVVVHREEVLARFKKNRLPTLEGTRVRYARPHLAVQPQSDVVAKQKQADPEEHITRPKRLQAR